MCSDELSMDAAGIRGSGGGPGVRPPDGSPTLRGLQEASVVGHDLVLRQVQVELQRHQDGELKSDELSAVHSEPFLQFLPGEKGRMRRCVSQQHHQYLLV